MVDLFDEVEEQLRSDRFTALARRAAPWITGIFAVVIVGYFAFWAYKLYSDRYQSTANVEYQKGVDALAQNDQAGALTHFQAAAKSAPPVFKALSLMDEGGIKQAAGKNQEAAALFDEAAKSAPNQIIGDLASLRAAEAVLDTAPYSQSAARLTPLTDPKRPFATYAREALAMAKLMAGKTAEARRDFHALTSLSSSFETPQDVRQRASFAIALIDSGEAQTAVAAVKQAVQNAATMPPPAAPNVSGPPPGASGQGGTPQPPAGAS